MTIFLQRRTFLGRQAEEMLWELGVSSTENDGRLPRLYQIRKRKTRDLNAVALVPALTPSDPAWLLPELGAGRITHVEVPLKCAFAVHASKHARPRTLYALLVRPSSIGVSMCNSGKCGRSRTSLQLDCRRNARTPCP